MALDLVAKVCQASSQAWDPVCIDARSDDDIEGMRFVRGPHGIDVRTFADTRRVRTFHVEARWHPEDGFVFQLPAVGCWCGQAACTCTLGLECVRIGDLSVVSSCAPGYRTMAGVSEAAFADALRLTERIRAVLGGCRVCCDLWSSAREGSSPVYLSRALGLAAHPSDRGPATVEGLDIAGGRSWEQSLAVAAALPMHRVPSRRRVALWNHLTQAQAAFHSVYASPYCFPGDVLLLRTALDAAPFSSPIRAVLEHVWKQSHVKRRISVAPDDEAALRSCEPSTEVYASLRALRCAMIAMAVAAQRHQAQPLADGVNALPVQPADAGDSTENTEALGKFLGAHWKHADPACRAQAEALTGWCGGLESRATTVRDGVAELLSATAVTVRTDTLLAVRLRLCGQAGALAASLLTRAPLAPMATATVRVCLYNYASMLGKRAN